MGNNLLACGFFDFSAQMVEIVEDYLKHGVLRIDQKQTIERFVKWLDDNVLASGCRDGRILEVLRSFHKAIMPSSTFDFAAIQLVIVDRVRNVLDKLAKNEINLEVFSDLERLGLAGSYLREIIEIGEIKVLFSS